ncbi:transmembrane protein 225 [Castor canadensis]
MVNFSNKNIQTINILFSSFALILLVIGVIMDEWVELIPKIKKNKISHSPWMTCCTSIWPEDDLEVVRIMMMLILGLSFHVNLIMGLQFTCILPQNKYMHFIIAFLSFFTGLLLLCTLIKYHLNLIQGQSIYFSGFKITWVILTAYASIVFFITCGVLCLIQCKWCTSCGCLKTLKSDEDLRQGGSSIKVISERTAMPRSIVRVQSTNMNLKENFTNKPRVADRHVSWAI